VLSYSPVGLVEAAMVAAPEAGVSTLSMARSRRYAFFFFNCSKSTDFMLIPNPATHTRPAWHLLALGFNTQLLTSALAFPS